MPSPDPGYVAPNPTTAMVKSAADYMYDYVRQAGGLTGWDSEVGRMPADPDEIVAFIDTSGPAGPSPKLAIDFPGVQVLVRGQRVRGYPTSHTKAREIRDRILGLDTHPVEFPWLDIVSERGTGPQFVGWDENDRPIWSSNFALIVEPGVSAVSHRASL